jgi:hypothetical protein
MPKLGWLLLGLDGLRPQACPKKKNKHAGQAHVVIFYCFFFKKKKENIK